MAKQENLQISIAAHYSLQKSSINLRVIVFFYYKLKIAKVDHIWIYGNMQRLMNASAGKNFFGHLLQLFSLQFYKLNINMKNA